MLSSAQVLNLACLQSVTLAPVGGKNQQKKALALFHHIWLLTKLDAFQF